MKNADIKTNLAHVAMKIQRIITETLANLGVERTKVTMIGGEKKNSKCHRSISDTRAREVPQDFLRTPSPCSIEGNKTSHPHQRS